MKWRFKQVLEKYDLGDGHAAPQVAKWLVDDDNFQETAQRVASRLLSGLPETKLDFFMRLFNWSEIKELSVLQF